MNSVAEDMKDVLVTDGVGTFATDLFVALMPDSPDACVCLYDTGSFGEPDHQNDIDTPVLQVVIRGAVGGYRTAYTKARSVRSSILGIRHTSVNSTRYVGVWVTSDIMFLQMDDKNRPVFSVNFRIQRGGTP